MTVIHTSMANKRDRRVGHGSNRQQNRVEPSTNDDRTAGSVDSQSNNQDQKRITILLVVFIVSSIISIILYRTMYAPPPRTIPSLPYVYQRGLVKTDVNYNDILTVRAVLYTPSLSFALSFVLF